MKAFCERTSIPNCEFVYVSLSVCAFNVAQKNLTTGEDWVVGRSVKVVTDVGATSKNLLAIASAVDLPSFIKCAVQGMSKEEEAFSTDRVASMINPAKRPRDDAQYWVKVMRGDVAIVTTNVAPTIREKGLSATIDGLKDAVKAKLPKLLADYDAPMFKVLQTSSDGTTSVESDKYDPPLLNNDKSSPYIVRVGE